MRCSQELYLRIPSLERSTDWIAQPGAAFGAATNRKQPNPSGAVLWEPLPVRAENISMFVSRVVGFTSGVTPQVFSVHSVNYQSDELPQHLQLEQ
jgi:hypothetical protein